MDGKIYRKKARKSNNLFFTAYILRRTMNNNSFDISFTELRCKEVVNASDGRRLGKITDIIFSGETGVIKGIVTPYLKRSMFSKNQEVFIPWRCVKKLGEDVIIVDIGAVEGSCDDECFEKEHKNDCSPPKCSQGQNCASSTPPCDGRCEKCMLFDCERRWKTT